MAVRRHAQVRAAQLHSVFLFFASQYNVRYYKPTFHLLVYCPPSQVMSSLCVKEALNIWKYATSINTYILTPIHYIDTSTVWSTQIPSSSRPPRRLWRGGASAGRSGRERHASGGGSHTELRSVGRFGGECPRHGGPLGRASGNSWDRGLKSSVWSAVSWTLSQKRTRFI